MALSYKQAKEAMDNSARLATTAQVASSKYAGLDIASYSNSEDYSLCTDGRYEVYENYFDENYSTIDKQKNVTIDPNQISICQEENSQYIPFKMPRYSDGLDLMSMLIQVHYNNPTAKGYNGPTEYSGDVVNAVNVAYNHEFITFGWLVDSNVTAIAGLVTFEITAYGVNEKNQSYTWRTKPNGKLTVLEALSYNHIIQPTNEWYTSFVFTMLSYVTQAADSAQEAKDSAASINVDSIKTDVIAGVTAEFDNKIHVGLAPYYTGAQVDEKVDEIKTFCESIDSLSQLKVEYDSLSGRLTFKDQENSDTLTTIAEVNINSLSNLNVRYEVNNGKGKLIFLNGTTEITSVEIGNVEPSAEWTAAFKDTISEDISTATETVQKSIDDLKAKVEAMDIPTVEEDLNIVKADVETLKIDVAEANSVAAGAQNSVGVLKSQVDGIDIEIQGLTTGLVAVEKKVDEIVITPSNTYEATYVDNIFTLLENGEAKNQFTITGGSGGGTDTSVITIDRITPDNIVMLTGGTAVIEYNFSSIDNAGDTTGNGTATWRVGNTTIATTAALQGKNSFNITEYLKTGINSIRLSITDSFGSISTKMWSVTVVEFKIESIFDDALFYSGDVTFRYTPYGNISKHIIFKLDDIEIGGTTTTITGRQMTQPIPAQSHGAHLLEVYMTAEINGQAVRSDSVFKDIIWVDAENTTPIIGCSVTLFTAKQYNPFTIPYVVYNPQKNPADVNLSVNGEVVSTLSIDRTKQIWSYKSSTIGTQTLTITCGNVVKTLTANIEDLGIEIAPVTTNLAFDFNPTGKNNNDADWLKINDGLSISVSANFDKVNGGYQIDSDGDTYFCIKAGNAAIIPYNLFADDAKKSGKNFKVIYKATNVKDYDATVLECMNTGIGFKSQAQTATLKSEQNEVSVPYCEDNYMELEFNILPDSQHTEMVMWIDSIPTRVKLYSTSDSFTQPNPQGITIGSDNCDVWIYRMKSYTMNLTDDEILDNRIADAKNADEIINRYMRNLIVGADGSIDPDILAERHPNLRIIKISAPHFTTGKKNEVANTSVQQIYKGGREVEDNWVATGTHKGQGTSSEYYGESARNIDIKLSGGIKLTDGTTIAKYGMTEASIPVNYFNIKLNVASSENMNNSFLAEEYNAFNPYLRQARKDNPMVRDTMEFHPCVVFVQETDTANATVFTDGAWHFYGCGDFGNSKKNNDVFGMSPDNHKECIVEVSNNTDDQTRFLSDDLTNEGWDGDTSFEFRYINDNCTAEEIQACKDSWQRLLSWVVNATKEQFITEFNDYFIKDSVLFYYLFTERHTMIDNRAKNTFWHTEDGLHWDICFDYDNDTAMGNDNEGGLTLTYGHEDTDMIGTKAVFNAHDSKIWCYVRDCFASDLQAMYIRMESKLAWSADRIIKACDDYQSVKPERLWITDMRRKYFRTYEDNGTTSYLPMMHGDKKHQRRQFQKYQEKYIASKYVGASCTSDVITVRGYTPANWTGVKPDGTTHIRPYADMYIVNRYGSNLIKLRAKRGTTYEVQSPIAAMNDTEVYFYTASMIQSMGDISGFYAGYTDFGQAVKLTDLHIGSDVVGYANTNMSNFDIGKNVLLERLNLQNLPNLKKTISLSDCKNLEEFYANGSGITGVIFAKGGKLRVANLPAISSLSAKNLYQLQNINFEGYNNITTLLIEDCPTINEIDLINKSTNLNRLRLTGIDWTIDSTDFLDKLSRLSGIDENGYNTANSSLSGKVHVPVMREQRLVYYKSIWPNLEITYDTMIVQYKVTFVNIDKAQTILDVQYVDKGASAVDPINRTENPIPVPELESTISTNFTYWKWSDGFVNVFSDLIIHAVYSESVREYTVQYKSKGLLLQETKAKYGDMVAYTGDMPTYIAEEAAYKYYLFSGWDKSGHVNGSKVINALFESCEYTQGYFDGKDLSTLTQVELYTIMKLGLETSVLSIKDKMDFRLGTDYSFSDIEEFEIISSDMKFDGTNYFDSGISIMNTDRDFTIAIDYEFAAGNVIGATLAQCFQYDGSNGFRLWWSNEPKLSWGTDSLKPSNGTGREIIVLRHKAGSESITIHNSNLSGNEITTLPLTAIRNPLVTSNLVFGATMADDGIFENKAKGTVHWCKVWYADLGGTLCSNMVQWTHETIPMELSKFKAYYLSEATSKRSSLTFMAANLLSSKKGYTSKSTNEGGWSTSTINTWMNTRLYKALSPLWKALIRPVKVYSSIGLKSNETTVSNCYFYIPSLYEIDGTYSTEPYINETNATISYMLNGTSRKRAKTSTPNVYESYWTRSPNVEFTNYIWSVDENGNTTGYSYPGYENGVLLMFSIGV